MTFSSAQRYEIALKRNTTTARSRNLASLFLPGHVDVVCKGASLPFPSCAFFKAGRGEWRTVRSDTDRWMDHGGGRGGWSIYRPKAIYVTYAKRERERPRAAVWEGDQHKSRGIKCWLTVLINSGWLILYSIGHCGPVLMMSLSVCRWFRFWLRFWAILGNFVPKIKLNDGQSMPLRLYRAPGKCLYVVARTFFLLLLNCSAWPCQGLA